ncbi:MAG: DUF2807 domain-containing protein [Chloroflexi bacterium]|nr:DUF2807 domain-containing protein [Chloroflexota bacterium]
MNERNNFFFPFLLIGAGTIWLLISLGQLPSANLWALTHAWPFLLIAAGLGLIVRSYWPSGGMAISALTVLGLLLAVLYAPQLGWNDANFWQFSFDARGGGVRGSGNVVTESRQLGDFEEITIEYPAQVVVRQGASSSVVIEAEDNLVQQLESEVRGDRLTIKNRESDWRDRVNPSEPVHLTITVVNLTDVHFPTAGELEILGLTTDSLSLHLGGAGNIMIQDLNADNFECRISGAGNIDANGTVQTMRLEISGFGNFDAHDLKSQTANVQINGAGNATVRVAEELTAKISGAGSVDYYGSPEVSRQISGLGSVTLRGN